MWLTKLKIAVVEKNTDNINILLDDIPKLEDSQEIQTALYLLKEASDLVNSLQDETKKSMDKIQKNLKFLKATQAPQTHKLDINS